MTTIVGVLNVTPDSFSDGGSYLDPNAAIAHGVDLVEAGATFIDIGGESTRPGAARIPIVEEQRRIIPVIRQLAREGIAISVDTMHSETARAAVDQGASIVNDVSAGQADTDMPEVVGSLGVPFIATHWRGFLHGGDPVEYTDVVADVVSELASRISVLLAAGIKEDRLIIDPGLGFHKGANENWQLLSHLDALKKLGYPVLVGASRKRFLQHMIDPAIEAGTDEWLAELDMRTAAVSLLCAEQDVWGVRVHNVAATKATFDVLRTLEKHA